MLPVKRFLTIAEGEGEGEGRATGNLGLACKKDGGAHRKEPPSGSKMLFCGCGLNFFNPKRFQF